jgi:monoamine oxidase
MVLKDLDFNHNKDWWCVEGGSQQVAHKMRKKIEANKKCISFQKAVTAIGLVEDEDLDEAVEVTIKGENSPRRYDAVFNSAPLGAMQRMNLSGLNLNWGTKQAIRSLGYGASCKVGIRFKNLWWIKHLNINKGGVAKTDLPLRVCVYPSYNINDNVDEPGVLLCSYTWWQEAQRVASLINNKSPEGEEELKTLLLHNLAKLHSKTNDQNDYNRVHQMISDAYDTHHAYDWYADPATTGAFVYFGPGQFRNMYPWITRNNGKHIIIGEAASAHHAWVVGALESAVRGVYQFLFKHSAKSKAAHEALQKYNHGEVESPFGPLPVEYDRPKDVEFMSTEVNTAVDKSKGAHLAREGEWAREQVIFESIRLEQGGDQLVSKEVTEAQIAPLLEVAAPA